MADLDGIPEAAVRSPLDHHAVGGRHDRGSPVRGVVDPPVGAPPFEHRVEATVAESRGDAPELEGLQEEGTPDRLPLQIEVRAPVVLVGIEPDGVEGLAHVDELGGENPTLPHGPVGADLTLEDDPEVVAPLHLTGEVELPLEHPVELVDQDHPVLVVEVVEGLVADDRLPQGGDHVTRDHHRVGVDRRLHQVGTPGPRRPGEAHRLVPGEGHVDPPERTLVEVAEGDLRPDPHPPGTRLLPEGHEQGLLLLEVEGRVEDLAEGLPVSEGVHLELFRRGDEDGLQGPDLGRAVFAGHDGEQGRRQQDPGG